MTERHNSLFQRGPITRLNACVGENGGPYDFADYAEGFFEGAFAQIEALRHKILKVDLLVYPIAFNFRQGIELYIKHLISEIERFSRDGTGFNKNHNLLKNWEILVSAAERFPKIFESGAVAAAGEIVTEFCEIDPSGTVFRYPEDLKGNPHLKELAIINVVVLGERMQVIYDLFRDWSHTFYQLH